MFNLTQHAATKEQIEAGVIDPQESTKECIARLLTFNTVPSQPALRGRAKTIARRCEAGTTHALIGGAPYLMSYLEHELKARGIVPVYAFSLRISEEHTNEQGQVVKTNRFVHLGFVEAGPTGHQS